MHNLPLILNTDRGLYCPAGDFYIDAWRRCLARLLPMRIRIMRGADQRDISLHPMACSISSANGCGRHHRYDRLRPTVDMNGVRVSLIRRGICLARRRCGSSTRARSGSSPAITSDSRIRPVGRSNWCRANARDGVHVWAADLSLARAGNWRADINEWWRGNVAERRTSILLAYSLGKRGRVLASVDPMIGRSCCTAR